jgi:hypothetical protein
MLSRKFFHFAETHGVRHTAQGLYSVRPSPYAVCLSISITVLEYFTTFSY